MSVIDVLRRGTHTLVGASLAERRTSFADAARDVHDVRARMGLVEARVASSLARFDRSPFHPAMTVHSAHARHPAVGAFFAARGLPACPDCAVGADETLAEAAFAEDFDLDGLLHEMNRLLP